MSSTYHVWKVDTENDSTSRQLALDLANGLVIVTVIGTMTFGIVLLYKYRCMKILIGYMMFSSMTLLGVLGAELFNVAIEKYRIPIDWFSFVFGLVNFAVVGVIAIFYQEGIPPYITQAYLIMSSVIIAWQLSHFDTISTWTLLVMLGLYDLCAVLTPCGPLRFLVNLMSDEDSPDMPGLLYEAEIPEGLKRCVSYLTAHDFEVPCSTRFVQTGLSWEEEIPREITAIVTAMMRGMTDQILPRL